MIRAGCTVCRTSVVLPDAGTKKACDLGDTWPGQKVRDGSPGVLRSTSLTLATGAILRRERRRSPTCRHLLVQPFPRSLPAGIRAVDTQRVDVGSVIAERYRVERFAHAGGMGVVYLGRDLQTGFEVGIKLLHASHDPSSSSRFWREAHALAALRHPGIVTYLAHGLTAGGEPYLIMEWLEGEDLAHRLHRAPLDVVETIRLGIRVCEALAAAHRRGIIHRDIKPANLLLPGGDIEELKVVDFGLARMGSAINASTPAGELMGTPGFIAPEQARSDPALNERADIYSVGAVLFACMTQRPPFVGEHSVAVLAKVLFDEPPRLCELRPEAPPQLDELVARLLAKEPDERPADAGEVAGTLLAILGELGGETPALDKPMPAITAGEQRFLTVLLLQHGAPAAGPRAANLARYAQGYGARLEELADGTIAGIFSEDGKPVEMAVRAARCALAMHADMGGPVVLTTGRGVVNGRFPVGQVIDRAVSLFMGDADTIAPGDTLVSPPSAGLVSDENDIVIDDVTAGLLDRRFSLSPVGPRRYRLEGAGKRDGVEPRLLGLSTQCVGRQRELATIEGIVDECLEEERARAVLVTGSAGAGKSRLTFELLRRITERHGEITVWTGRGDWLRSGASCGLLAEVIRDAMDLAESQPLSERRARISRRVAAVVDEDHEDGDRVSAFLGELVNAPFEGAGRVQLEAARQDPHIMHDQMQRAFVDWLGAELARAPVLIVLDDLHWGDWPTIRFVEAALRSLRDRPLLTLALARPDVQELFPNLFAARDLEEIRLRPLPRRACQALVRQVLDIPEEVLARLVERSEGNAFYLEELIRNLAGGGGDAFPQTVLAMAESRLSTLPSDGRRVLRAASVFGPTFWRGGVAALLGEAMGEGELALILDELVEREFIVAQSSSRFADDVEYRFGHELTHEAAYGTLTEEDRMRAHLRAGAWSEGAGERESIVLAEHYRRGGALGRAVAWYRRSAEQALEANDTEAVLERVARTVECGASGETLGALELLRAEVHNWRGEPEAARRAGCAAIRLLPAGCGAWADAVNHTAWAAGSVGDFDEVETLVTLLVAHVGNATEELYIMSMAHCATQLACNGREARARDVEAAIARELPRFAGKLRATAAVTHMRSYLTFMNDEFDRACDLMRAAAESWRTLGNERGYLMSLGNAGYTHLELGEYPQAAETLRTAVEGAARAGLEHLVITNEANRALALAYGGHIADAERLCRTICAGGCVPRQEALVRTYLAQILLLDNRAEDALASADGALALAGQFPSTRAQALGVRAQALLALGRTGGALAAASDGMAILRAQESIESGESALRLVHAEALFAEGEAEAAREAIRGAEQRLRSRAARISDPVRRASFLERVPEHARTLARARAWLD